MVKREGMYRAMANFDVPLRKWGGRIYRVNPDRLLQYLKHYREFTKGEGVLIAKVFARYENSEDYTAFDMLVALGDLLSHPEVLYDEELGLVDEVKIYEDQYHI